MTPAPDQRRLLHLRKSLDTAATPLPDVAADLVDSLLRAGDRAGAIEVYREFEARFPIHAQTATRLKGAYERALWADPGALPTNLPIPRGRFVGRHDDLARVVGAATQERFLCLAGPGGIGKSRIALESARTWVAAHPDGVWWLDCTAVTSEHDLPALVRRVLSLEDRSLDLETIFARLENKRIALVMDCCESLPGPIASFAKAAIARAPGLRILATSRLPLEGSFVIDVPPLSLPAAHLTRSNAPASDAVRLFIERAVSADPRFALTEQNAAVIAHVCRLLDGMPLAIELAAAYLTHVDIEELARRLDQRSIDDLTLTLERTIDWAYRLLAPDDAALLRGMSLFPSRWTFDDAIGMSGSRMGVERLVASSLVVAERSTSGFTLYRMLDTTRAFARDRLNRSDDAPSVRERFLTHMLAAADRLADRLDRGDENAPLQARDAYDALAAAIDAGLADDRLRPISAQIAGRIVVHLGALGFASDLAHRVRALTHRLRGTPFEASIEFDRTLRAQGWLANRLGEYREALVVNEELISRARHRGDGRILAQNLALAVVVYCNAGELERALEVAREALALARESGDQAILGRALRAVATVLLNMDRASEAMAPLEEFLGLGGDEIPKMQQAMGMNDYAEALRREGRLEEARTWLERAAAIAMQMHDYGTATHVNAILSVVLTAIGDLAAAHAAAAEAVRLSAHNVNVLTRLFAIEELVASSIDDAQLPDLAFLVGYVDGVRRRYGVALTPEREPRVRAIRSVLRGRMGEAFAGACAAGTNATLEQSLERASRLRPGGMPLERADRFAALTPRERDVAELASAGKSNREIADALFLSVRTVEVHVASAFKKLGITRREKLRSST